MTEEIRAAIEDKSLGGWGRRVVCFVVIGCRGGYDSYGEKKHKLETETSSNI